MLEKQQFSNGIIAYTSPLLREIGVRHAFSTRVGGSSPPPFDSMNLGNPSGSPIQDDYARIWENYRRLHEALGMPQERPCRVHQVHAGTVVRGSCGQAFDTDAKADAIVSDDPTRVLSVRVADCVPILLSSQDGTKVAAVHAGWRGVIAGVVPAALAELGVEASRCVAAIGPCISEEAFEVGLEVVDVFEQAFGPGAPCRRRDDGKGRVDLREAVRRQLTTAGIPVERIDVSDRCTFRDVDEFFSHRRENGITGRMAALIQARAG